MQISETGLYTSQRSQRKKCMEYIEIYLKLFEINPLVLIISDYSY